MRSFDYHRPSSLPEAARAFSAVPDTRLLAGGMTLIPAMKMRLTLPPALVDLGGLAELRGIRAGKGEVGIGAMTRHADVAASADVRRLIPALSVLAGGIGDPQVRNRGTIGGSIANNDPAADYPAALLGLGATITTSKRKIPADRFFVGMFETALEAGEIILQVTFPLPAMAAYEKFRSPASRYALVGVFVARTSSGVRVAVTGAAPYVFRATALESLLSEKFAPEALAGFRFPADGLNADMHGDAQFRANLISVLTRRAVATLVAGGGKN
ncbi:MAG: xanthine dehydrogenase family protein subunit M [Betaproteobacteria bacterium]|nr:xanthine dehydrogenase family protein subunit M [Betaproteobacteria bacterium]